MKPSRSFILIPFLLAVFTMLPITVTSAAVHHHRHQTYTPSSTSVGQLQQFETESAAQAHCPRDVVVWLNTRTGIYHEKGMRWYGNTREGAYVCRREADAAGDRDTRNGQ